MSADGGRRRDGDAGRGRRRDAGDQGSARGRNDRRGDDRAARGDDGLQRSRGGDRRHDRAGQSAPAGSDRGSRRDGGSSSERSSSDRRRPQRASRQVAPARQVAFDVLEAVRESEAYANLLLPARIERAGLDEADARLATELTYGTLRLQGTYDAVIELAANRPPEHIDPAVLDVLRLGAHQLLATRVATHAAVNEQVALAHRVAPAAAGFVNAVLRTISRTDAAEWRRLVAEETSTEDARLAVLHSHPQWIVRALRAALARDDHADELEALLEADNAAPRVNLAALPGLGDEMPDELGEPNRFSPIGLTAEHPLALVAAHEGRVRVQDEGSQLAALALTRARPVEPGERWLDLCAGPGGKTAVLAAEALAHDAVLVANELAPARAELVRRSIAGVPLDVHVRVGDGREIDPAGLGAPEGFDRILLDAPCTGLGALRRRPEARWRKAPSDVPELTALQGELFDAAVRALRPGGLLAYVTCSPHTAETHGSFAAGLKRWGAELQPVDTRAALEALSRHPLGLEGDGRTAQLWPHRHGTDAMFIALVRRAG
ncbi:RsmB/NOP family class I SAM-dependent RNA methyltransferase [Agromyces aerolatus]|uniref:RsmB/NOP family class I SAM-dependent RNA methyltransferase n=1 Tax=Agromyces sp. LY-1074 TaxID=3074080 RepID=UPI0028676B98|nr:MULTISPECIES: transcription antitermination factor NusB [unclassified Agromyces]MDR5700640.1 transcription antitermination factor NusB [Agromyces sp. LY-1074]MDR5707161.1 transcription antitermination factor NusB [Agromyces sp. LY-1358]